MRDWITHLPWCDRQSWPKNGLDYWSAGRQVRPMSKIVLHSTETVGFPGYADGAAAPHFTVSMKTGTTRQHIPLSRGGRALTLAGTRLANVAGVIQIEILGAVTPGYPKTYGHYDLPNTFPKDPNAQRYLARLLAAIHVETGIPLVEDVDWITYPASSGRYAPQRQRTEAQYLAYVGVLGHQHVVGNEHGDPGALPVGSVVLPLARSIVTGNAPKPPAPVVPPPPPPPPPPVAPTTPGRSGSVFYEGADGPDVHAWQADLHMLYGGLPGAGTFGPKTTALTKTHQSVLGVTPDGRVGPATLTAHERYLMSLEKKIDALTGQLGKVHQDVAARLDELNTIPTPASAPSAVDVAKATVTALMRHRLQGLSVDWWLRRGLVIDKAHPQYPADPGSPADLELRVAAKTLGTHVTPYDGTQKR